MTVNVILFINSVLVIFLSLLAYVHIRKIKRLKEENKALKITIQKQKGSNYLMSCNIEGLIIENIVLKSKLDNMDYKSSIF